MSIDVFLAMVRRMDAVYKAYRSVWFVYLHHSARGEREPAIDALHKALRLAHEVRGVTQAVSVAAKSLDPASLGIIDMLEKEMSRPKRNGPAQ